MKKLKNKFILTIFILLGITIFFQGYRAYYSLSRDTNSYIFLVKGRAILNQTDMSLEEKYALTSGDSIQTIGKESFAILEWGDGSITRLGGDTKISISKTDIKGDYSRVNISFELFSGKTWSNVVSFIGKDSSFVQVFNGVEAGVRGTVFDVDINKSFVSVSDHQVHIKKDGQEYLVSENQILSFKSFSFIDFSEYLNDFRDTTWVDINQAYDVSHLMQLRNKLEEQMKTSDVLKSFGVFSSLKSKFLSELKYGKSPEKVQQLFQDFSGEDKKALYLEILTQYQKFNFVKSDDVENYKKKLTYKQMLLELSDTSEKELLLQYSFFDLQEALSSDNNNALDITLGFLEENTEIIKNMNISSFKKDLQIITQKFENTLDGKYQSILDVFSQSSLGNSDFDILGGKEILKGATQKAKDKKQEVEQVLKNQFETILDSLNP